MSSRGLVWAVNPTYAGQELHARACLGSIADNSEPVACIILALRRAAVRPAVRAAAQLDRIARRSHTLSQLLEDGYAIRAADMPGADDLMMRVYATMNQKERELISERTRGPLAAARARGKALDGERGYRPVAPPDSRAAAVARGEAANRAAHRIPIELAHIRGSGVTSLRGLARELKARGVATPGGSTAWTLTTVSRLLGRVGTCSEPIG